MIEFFTDEFKTDVKASSQTVGYIMMLAIFLGAGLALFTVSVGVFTDTGSTPEITEQTERMEQLQTEFNKFTDGTPYRSSSVEVSDGSIYYGDPVHVSITVDSATGDPLLSSPDDCDLGVPCVEEDVIPIVHQTESGESRYVNGALLQKGPTGDALLREAGPWRVGDYSRVPVLETRHNEGPSSVAASGLPGDLRVEGYANSTETFSWDSSAVDQLEVTVELDNLEHPEAWENHFEQADSYTVEDVDTDAGYVEVSFTTDRIIVRHVVIDVTLGT